MSTTGGRPASGGAPRSQTAPTSGRGPQTAGTSRPRAAAPAAARPTGRVSPTAAPGDTEPRKVKLTVSRIDPFSVMKISFLLSVALGIAGVVVVAVLWMLLNSMGVFAVLNDSVNDFQASTSGGDRISVLDYLGLGRVLSLSVVFGVVDVILMTAIATITAFVYNICAALVGGMQVTLTDD